MKKNSYFCAGVAVLLAGCTPISKSMTDVERRPVFDGEIPVVESIAPPVRLAKNASGGAANSSYFQTSDRMVAYTAGFTLSVKQRDAAVDDVKQLAESLKGYIVSSRKGNMTIKVPVQKADEFLKSSGKYGKVSDFYIQADDLTDTITDLTVRLDNLRKLRTRLTELLASAKNVDEMLKVERELNRVTTEIESLAAVLKNNQNQVDFVTFTVSVIEEKGAMPGGVPMAIDHFAFLEKLSVANGGTESKPLFGIVLPGEFISIEHSSEGYTAGFAATSSDDCIFRTWEERVANDSTVEFWEKMICRTLGAKMSFDHIKSEKTLLKGNAAVKITAKVTTSGGLQSYLAVIAIDDCWGSDKLQIVEFFGPEEAYAKHEKEVLDSLQK